MCGLKTADWKCSCFKLVRGSCGNLRRAVWLTGPGKTMVLPTETSEGSKYFTNGTVINLSKYLFIFVLSFCGHFVLNSPLLKQKKKKKQEFIINADWPDYFTLVLFHIQKECRIATSGKRKRANFI